MIRGLYSAASGIRAQSTRADIYASNMANVSTSGYLRTRVSQTSFPAELVVSSAFDEATGELTGGATVVPAGVDTTPGPIERTANNLDLAIGGSGFFCVRTPDGNAYTRNGEFELDASGTIVNHDGYPLLGKRGTIRITTGTVDVSEDGLVADGGRIIDALQIVDIQDSTKVTKRGATLLTAADVVTARDFTITQGAIEGSNVNAMQELQKLMSVQREYEANIRSIQAQDDTLNALLQDVVG